MNATLRLDTELEFDTSNTAEQSDTDTKPQLTSDTVEQSDTDTTPQLTSDTAEKSDTDTKPQLTSDTAEQSDTTNEQSTNIFQTDRNFPSVLMLRCACGFVFETSRAVMKHKPTCRIASHKHMRKKEPYIHLLFSVRNVDSSLESHENLFRGVLSRR